MKKNKKPLVMGLFIVLLGIIGSTIAYYTSNTTFTNEFNTGKYIIESSETFESPDNWMPGDQTSKQLVVTNQGTIPAAVRVYFEESWIDKDGNPLPLYVNTNPVSIINFSNNSQDFWYKTCDDLNNSQKYYYYYKVLNPNESTKPIIDSVLFNPNIQINDNVVCTNDDETHTQVCTSTFGGYTGGKYTLTVHMETVQYNKYHEIWGSPEVERYNNCEELDIKDENYDKGVLMHSNNMNEKFIANHITRDNFEKITFVDNTNVPVDAIYSFDASINQDQTVKAWYTDTDNNGLLELYIGANGKVIANPNSVSAFADFTNVKQMDLRNLNTSRLVDMSDMFSRFGENLDNFTIIGIEDLNTSNVRIISNTFAYAGGDNTTIDFSNWDTSNVDTFCTVFNGARFTHIGTDSWLNTCVG